MTFHSTQHSLLAAAAGLALLAFSDTAAAQSAGASVGTTPESTPSAASEATAPAADPPAGAAGAIAAAPPKEPVDPLVEKHDHWYLWLGAGYQGTVLPAFLLGAFVKGAPTTYFSTFKLSADFRKNNFSVVPSLAFTEFGSGDILFAQRGKSEAVNGNWSVVNSNIKMISAEVQLLWSSKVHRMVDIEYGLGAGLGMTFDNLGLNWVYADANGQYTSESGRSFSKCASNQNPPGTTGCTSRDHSNSETERVGNYKEPSWFNGGSKPSFLPVLTPIVGVRVKPHQNFMTRVGIGWGLYGPWFGINGYYGFDKPIGRAAPPRPRGSEEEVVETSE